MLEVEISTIYKKSDKTRKIHHLIYAPDFATADRIAERLGRIGNIKSDGRPILGLDSRDLLEITLESGPGAYLVPAHIWTPWFAALGSQSGFDTIADCYGDLAPHIFAVETGLSSDPPMNWRVSFLDRYRLTSNSDAHSPGKLGREATAFDCDMDYFALRRALETGAGYVGTVEFFPEEGKYHLDGHRKCEVRLTPKETLQHGGRCPVCGEKVTVGVEHRVEVLGGSRLRGDAARDRRRGRELVPLPEMLSEIAASGVGSKTVDRMYDRVVGALGPELSILGEVPVEDIARAESSVLAEAITRLRAGKVIRDAGYDGEYGVIKLFEDGELKRLGGMLFEAPVAKRASAPKPQRASRAKHPSFDAPSFLAEAPAPFQNDNSVLGTLDPEQRRAAEIVEGPLLILAGPGAGKTRTLTHRIAHLVADRGVPPQNCLAVTFTRRAAAEMRERLTGLLGARAADIAIHTFHSLGLAILRAHPEAAGLRDFRIASEAERSHGARRGDGDLGAQGREPAARDLEGEARGQADADTAQAVDAYARAMRTRNWIDFDDLVGLALRVLTEQPEIAAQYREKFRFISVDEFQDIDEPQYRLIAQLAPPGANLCVIGDPDQAIYGFRGADASCFARLRRDYAPAEVRLQRNYRSSGTIVAASAQMLGSREGAESIVRAMHERITIHAAPTERAEAEFIVQTIEGLIGGHSFFSVDSGRAGRQDTDLSFGDFAVLYRTDAQSGPLDRGAGTLRHPVREERPRNADALADPEDSDRDRYGAPRRRRSRRVADAACRQGTRIPRRVHRRT